MRKVTVQATSDVALIKYWGVKDKELRLPMNGSIALTLDNLHSTSTVEFDPTLARDQITIDGKSIEAESSRASKHLDRIREIAMKEGLTDKTIYARVSSENNFPTSTGLSSSGSGFAALTIAASAAIGLDLSEKELSILSRQGSGSSCRCVCAGIVEWQDGNSSEESFAQTLYPAEYWPIVDLVAVVSSEKKELSSADGHQAATTSPFFKERQKNIKEKIIALKDALKKKDFQKFGEITEAEALEFHSILLTSQPPIILLRAGTMAIIHLVQELRKAGVPAYFTINTGFNVHVITLPEYERVVRDELKKLNEVQNVLTSKLGQGPKFLEEHLF